MNVQEVREIRFWFKLTVAEERRDELTEDFFKDLLSPTDFPTGTPSLCCDTLVFIIFTTHAASVVLFSALSVCVFVCLSDCLSMR